MNVGVSQSKSKYESLWPSLAIARGEGARFVFLGVGAHDGMPAPVEAVSHGTVAVFLIFLVFLVLVTFWFSLSWIASYCFPFDVFCWPVVGDP